MAGAPSEALACGVSVLERSPLERPRLRGRPECRCLLAPFAASRPDLADLPRARERRASPRALLREPPSDPARRHSGGGGNGGAPLLRNSPDDSAFRRTPLRRSARSGGGGVLGPRRRIALVRASRRSRWRGSRALASRRRADGHGGGRHRLPRARPRAARRLASRFAARDDPERRRDPRRGPPLARSRGGPARPGVGAAPALGTRDRTPGRARSPVLVGPSLAASDSPRAAPDRRPGSRGRGGLLGLGHLRRRPAVLFRSGARPRSAGARRRRARRRAWPCRSRPCGRSGSPLVRTLPPRHFGPRPEPPGLSIPGEMVGRRDARPFGGGGRRRRAAARDAPGRAGPASSNVPERVARPRRPPWRGRTSRVPFAAGASRRSLEGVAGDRSGSCRPRRVCPPAAGPRRGRGHARRRILLGACSPRPRLPLRSSFRSLPSFSRRRRAARFRDASGRSAGSLHAEEPGHGIS